MRPSSPHPARPRASLRAALRLPLLGAWLAVAAAPATAYADAHKHFLDGMALFTLAHYDEAISEFEAGFREEQRPAFLYNIAQAHLRAGRPGRAIEMYQRYLELSGNGADRAEVEARIAEAQRELARQRAAAQQKAPAGATSGAAPTDDPARRSSTTGAASSTSSGAAGVPPAAVQPGNPALQQKAAPARRTWPIWVGVIGGVVVVGAVTAAVIASQGPGVTVITPLGDAR